MAFPKINAGDFLSQISISYTTLLMKIFLTILFIISCTCAQAAESQLLVRALSCELTDNELPTLIHDLARQQPAFRKPTARYGAPTANVYQLPSPITAFGYSSSLVVVTPARILLAVQGVSLDLVIDKLELDESPFSPANRAVRPTVSIVAFQLSHKALENKLLVGCEYATSPAVEWPEADDR